VHKINVRFIAAASRSLRELVERGEFREDLFYRLYVYPIEIPSLSQRREDIPLLAHHFLRKFAREQQKKVENISGDLMEFLKNQTWTGNIRELENLVERLVTLSPAEARTMDAAMLPAEFQDKWANRSSQKPITESLKPLKASVAELEKKSIENALILCDWNQSRAARMLQISEHSIRYKMKKLGINIQH
jgi:DNA-binding NtrC family response regulator